MTVALKDAVLCLDCEQITAAKNGHCPVCASTALMSVPKVLDREPAQLPGDIAGIVREARLAMGDCYTAIIFDRLRAIREEDALVNAASHS